MLAPLGLRLSPEKTRVVHIDEGFDFLGFHIRRMRKRGTDKRYVYTTPSRKSIQSIKDKVSELTYRSTRYQSLAEVITSLNQALAGWANYFRHGVSKAVFGAVDHHAWGRVMRWTRRKYEGRHRLGMPEMKTPLLRPRLAVRPREGRVHRRLQRQSNPLPLPRKQHPDPLDPEIGSRHHQRLNSGKDTWSARCPERGTPGAGGGMRETDDGSTETAPACLPHPPSERPFPVVSAPSSPSQSNISRARKIKTKTPSEPLTDIGASICASRTHEVPREVPP